LIATFFIKSDAVLQPNVTFYKDFNCSLISNTSFINYNWICSSDEDSCIGNSSYIIKTDGLCRLFNNDSYYIAKYNKDANNNDNRFDPAIIGAIGVIALIIIIAIYKSIKNVKNPVNHDSINAIIRD